MKRLFLSFVAVTFLPSCLGADEAGDLRQQAAAAWETGQREKALDLASQAITAAPAEPAGYLLRGKMLEAAGKHKEAVADFGKCIGLDPTAAEAYDHRGSERFKVGDVKGSVEDFDRYLKLRPRAFPSHWKRGISLYYVGRFDDGRKQFEGYQKYDDNDVENAVWHFLCAAKKDGLKKAQAAILPIKRDGRVPMMEVYDLFKGKLKPADVLAAANKGEGEAKRRQLFYAHLYLGLYHDALGEKDKARPHIEKAAKGRIGHYMGDVAVVHLARLKGTGK